MTPFIKARWIDCGKGRLHKIFPILRFHGHLKFGDAPIVQSGATPRFYCTKYSFDLRSIH